MFELEFYGDLVKNLTENIGWKDLFWSVLHKCYATDCMLSVNPITVNNFTDLLNSTPVGASDLLMAQA